MKKAYKLPIGINIDNIKKIKDQKMNPRLNQHSSMRTTKSPQRGLAIRSISSNGKQFALPKLTPLKSSKFSQDSSKWARRPEAHNPFHNYEKIMKEKQKYSSIIKALRTKIQKAEKIKETYGIEIPKDLKLTPFNLKKLEISAKLEKETEILKKAVNFIETWYKKRIIRRKFHNFNKVLHKSASLIQKFWRKHYNKKKFHQTVKAMQSAAVKIQKLIRGYLVRKSFVLKIKEMRMLKVFEYFDKEKMKIMQEAARKIWAFWMIAKKKWAKKQILNGKKGARRPKRRKAEEFSTNSFAAFPEAEKSKMPEGFERPKKNLSIKAYSTKKSSTPASPMFTPARPRANTDASLGLEVIKEVKHVKEE